MSNNNVYLRKDGRWEARLIIGKNDNGKRIYRSFYGSSKEDAWQKLTASRRAALPEYPVTCLTVFDVTTEYIRVMASRIKQSTAANYRMKAEKHIIPQCGGNICSEVQLKDIYAFMERKAAEGLSSRYISDIIVLMKSVFKYAVRTYHIPNVFDGIVMPKRTKADVKILSANEQARLMKYVKSTPNLTTLGVALSLYTGLRVGELCALQWSDIDLEKRTLTVRKTIQRITASNCAAKTKLVITAPKSSSSERVIPLPKFIVDMLNRYVCSPECFVLSGSEAPVEPRKMQYRFARMLKNANLPSVHFHSLRHAFATNCIEKGFDVKTLSEILGHSSVEITLNRYVHSSLDRKRACMDKLTWAA